jgi:hypothetical protein
MSSWNSEACKICSGTALSPVRRPFSCLRASEADDYTVFLRILEYYEGVLFMTTNRITTFDLAFKSRVHLALKYKALEPDARRVLWKNFLNRTSSVVDMDTWHDALDRLAAIDLNGRQIKNAVRTANALAECSGEELLPDHLDMVLETLLDFETALNEQTQDVHCSSPANVHL